MSTITFVTGLWDLGRETLRSDFHRIFSETYIPQLRQLLSSGLQFIVFGDEYIRNIVTEYSNARFVFFAIDEFRNTHEFEEIQRIRKSPFWYDQPDAQWLKYSPQAALEYYIPVTFEKIHFIQKASKLNFFNSDKFYWLDAGTIRDSPIQSVIDLPNKLVKYNNFIFINTVYTENSEIHGFRRDIMNRLCKVSFINVIGKGMFLGGPIGTIDTMVELHDKYITDMIQNNCLGTEECIYTILSYRHTNLISKIILPYGNFHYLEFIP